MLSAIEMLENLEEKEYAIPETLQYKGHFVDNGILSNMRTLSRPILWREKYWRNTESIYVAEKNPNALVNGKPFLDYVHEFCSKHGWYKAKSLGKPIAKGGMIDPTEDWSIRRIGVMAAITAKKFSADRREGQWLKTAAPENMIEWNNWNDRFWGVAFRKGDVNASGLDMLGRIVRVHHERLNQGQALYDARPEQAIPLARFVLKSLSH